jgi:hypothetical protein
VVNEVNEGFGFPEAKKEWEIVDLEKILFEKGFILDCNDALYAVLLMRMERQLVLSVGVPK